MTEPTETQIAEADALLRQFADGNAAENLAAFLAEIRADGSEEA